MADTPELFVHCLRVICRGLGMQHFVALRLRGGELQRLVQIVHDAPEAAVELIESLEHWRECNLINAFRQQCPPAAFGPGHPIEHLPGLTGFECGVAAAVAEDRGATVLLLGRSDPPVAIEHMSELMGFTLLSASAASESLAAAHARNCPLTPRELECLTMHMASISAKEMARALNLSARTIEEYLIRARDALGAENSLHAGVLAIDNGWIALNEVQRYRA